MLGRLATCSWVQGLLLFVMFHSITCDCPFPKNNLENGRFVFTKPSDVNETTAKELYVLRFKCYTGYQRIGPRFIQCVDEEWSDVVPTCAKMQCLEPPVVENAEDELHSGVNDYPTLGSFVTYTCNVGFELNDTSASTLHCVLDPGANRPKWKGEMPFCKEKETCPDPGVSKHGFRKGACCFSGDVLHYFCEEDYELVGKSEITCLAGSWSAGRPLCKPLGDHCETPPSIPNGIVTGIKDGDYFLPYDEAEVLCKPGYRYKGASKFVYCEEEGEWEEEFGECIEIFCDAPKPLANGTIPELLMTNQTSFPHNFELTYICDEGFRLIGGDSWRICDKNGWSGKTPRCEAVLCPDPGVPENGDRSGSSFAVGAKVRFKCFTGYELIGSFERYCKPNGQWTGELSRCDSPTNYCPNPGIPIKGYKNSSNYDMGDKVGFRCQPGYMQLGSEARECLPNKTWSGTETTCLGPYDFDNSAHVRDTLKAQIAEKAEEQEKETNKFLEALHASYFNGSVPIGRAALDINFPGRLILYFAFDVSGSVGPHNFDKSIEFAKAIVKRVGISENGARAGALTFSSEAENMFLPLNHETTEDVLEALDKIRYTGGGTAASSALSLIREQNIPLVEENLGKLNIKSIIFIITDGKANMGGSPEKEAEELKKAGVEIYCIGITGSVEKESLYKIASKTTDASGEHHNVYILQNYATLSWLVQEITNGTVDYSQCGLGMEKVGIEGHQGRIAGGKLSSDPWPWMAALYMPPLKSKPKEIELQCGGSIINENFILTAAHCMYNSKWEKREVKDIIVKLGLTDIKNETYVQESEVVKMYIHPNYRPGPLYDYDVALLRLDRPIEYNAFVRPICLPPLELPADSPLYSPEEFGWATGWGHTEVVKKMGTRRIKTSQILKEILLPFQTSERCIQSLVDNKYKPTFFTDRMICAGDGKRGNDTCQGDSGGPLMQSQLNSEGYLYWTQVGIVSWGIGCGVENTYGYYSHVQRLRPWIDNTIQEVLSED